MTNPVKFLDLLNIDKEKGTIAVKGSSELDALQELMRETGASMDPALHSAMGAAVREPIRTLARYRAWTQVFFEDYPVGLGEENPVLLDSPIGTAFVSSPEGRVEFIAPGVQRVTYPTFTRIKAALLMRWDDLAIARWNLFQRRMEESADVMAKRRDVLAQAVIDAAITAAGHNTNVSTSFNKSDFDAKIIAAVQTGWPITQVAVNPGRIMDMAAWTNGTTSALPAYFAPQSQSEAVYKQLWFNGYGNLRYFLSHNVPMSKIYFGGDPSGIGYAQSHGPARSVSQMDIDNMADKHLIWEDAAWYLQNIYNVWSITIT